MTDASWAFSDSDPTVAQHPKLKKDESFAISYPPDEVDLGSAPNNQGQVVRMFRYKFFAYPPIGQPGKVQLLVQGEGPDGNTVSVKKKITVSDWKKITDPLP
jgi:hypothetical protein